MANAVSCPYGFHHPNRAVVLLVHGMGSTAREAWPDGFGKVLTGARVDWCMVDLPGRALIDIQTSTEYVVFAVRQLHALTGRKVDLAGHSEGAQEARWAVRWWPDVRADVDDLVTFEGVNQGFLSAIALCPGLCKPAVWQSRHGSNLMSALNRIPTPPGPSYTAIYSLTDVFSTIPAPLDANTIPGGGATNIAIQSICPARFVDHVQAIFDAASQAIALDAFDHSGPAVANRIDRTVCAHLYGPGIDPILATVEIATTYQNAETALLSPEGMVTREPALRPYARSG